MRFACGRRRRFRVQPSRGKQQSHRAGQGEGARVASRRRRQSLIDSVAIRPIFVFSITRSGSTLVQRVIAAHDGVATVSEPWLLLPYLYALRREGVNAEYTHRLLVTAIEDFCDELPAGSEDYRRELHDFVLRLYEKAAGPDARYFLDKSPPYYFVAEEIMRLFPEGKFVFLWRNPLSIIASIIETWTLGRWSPTLFRQDLFIGLPRLVRAYARNRSRAHAVRFEDLIGGVGVGGNMGADGAARGDLLGGAAAGRDVVAGGPTAWRRLMDYLEIEFDPAALQRFTDVELTGRMGDQIGTARYSCVSAEPAQKWAETIANPLRTIWCRRYLRFLGDERLSVMGYDADQLIEQLDSRPLRTSLLLEDLRSLVGDVAREPVRARMRRHGVGGPNVIRELLRA
jgi:Sulfotransferase family